MYDAPILPLGKIDLETGNSRYFNVYEAWGEDTTYEIYKLDSGKFRIVATSGTSPIEGIGSRNSFMHDQTHRYIFDGILVDYAVGSDLKSKIEKYGKKISGYTYK